MSKYPVPVHIHRTHIRVRYAETDQMGVAYYANYLVWFEQARTEYLHAIGCSYRRAEESGYYLPVVEANCRYKAPARFDDEIEIETRILKWDKLRIEIEYQAKQPETGKLLAEGRTLHVWTDRDLKVIAMPESFFQVFINL